MVIDVDREDDFHHALGHGVNKSDRQFDLDSEFHHALGQGVDKSSRQFDLDSEHVSEQVRIRRSSK